MDTRQRSTGDLIDVVRVLLLLQAAILIVTTIEALVLGMAFGAGAAPAAFSATSALAILFARARIRSGSRKPLYIVEGTLLLSLAVDAALMTFLRGGTPPLTTLITRGLIPVMVVALVRRSEGVTYGQSALPDQS